MSKKDFYEVDHEPMKPHETHTTGASFSRGVNGQPIPTPLPTCTHDLYGFVNLWQSLWACHQASNEVHTDKEYKNLTLKSLMNTLNCFIKGIKDGCIRWTQEGHDKYLKIQITVLKRGCRTSRRGTQWLCESLEGGSDNKWHTISSSNIWSSLYSCFKATWPSRDMHSIHGICIYKNPLGLKV